MSNDNDDVQTEALAIIENIERLAMTETVDGVADVLVVPSGKRIEDLRPIIDARLPAPRRRTGTARVTTLESFTALVRRFADEHSAIFAVDDRRAPRLIAVLDYHEQTAKGAPRFGTHRVEYAFPLSDEWRAWLAFAARDQISQRDLAEFLEEHIVDVRAPESLGEATTQLGAQLGITYAGPAALMALSRGLSIRVDQKVTQAINLSTGEASLGFEETHSSKDGTGPLKVPGGFALAIPVFRGGKKYVVAARLRYRLREGAVTWRVALHRVDAVFDDAFSGACADVLAQTEAPLFYGQPES